MATTVTRAEGALTRLREYSPRARQAPAWRLLVEALGVFLVSWVLYVPYLSQETFIDEWDNIIGGNVVAHGGAIYVDYLSQHMPGAYWISAIGHLLGADGLAGQRMLGYGVFSLLLAAFYVRNAPTFGRLPVLLVVPLVPMLHFYNPPLSYTVLSDNYEAIAVLFLLYEVVAIGVHGGKALSRWLVLGLAGALAVSVAFISVYIVAAAVTTAAALSVLEARHSLRAPRQWLRPMAARVGVLAAPFVLVVAVVAASGAITAGYQQAYVLNRTYYSPYLGGYASDAFRLMYQGFVDIARQTAALGDLLQANRVAGVRNLVALALLAVTVVMLMRLRVTLGIGVLWMASLAAPRSWDGFHAQPLWVYMIGILGILVWLLAVSARDKPHALVLHRVAIGAVGVATVLAAVPYATNVYELRAALRTPVVLDNARRDAVITALTPEGEKYGDFSIGTARDFVATRRLPAGGFAGVVPWFSDMMDDEMAARLAADRPVLVFSDESTEVWGVNVIQNAPRLAQVLADDYTRVNLSPIDITEGVYIRNDALDDSLAKLDRLFPGSELIASALYQEVTVCRAASYPYGELSDGVTLTQTFTTDGDTVRSALVRVATYQRHVSGTLTMEIHARDGSVLGSASVDLSTVQDNGGAYFVFDKDIPTRPGEQYTGEWHTRGVAAGGGIALWGSSENCTDEGVAAFDGAPIEGDLDLAYFT